MSAADLVTVRLLGLPVADAALAREHFAELSREFALLAAADESLEHHVPGRLLRLVDALRSRFADFTSGNDALLDEAIARGDTVIDLAYEVPAAAAPAALELAAILDEADRFCADGEHLLTLATPPPALVYRRWYLEQFAAQAGGDEAVSFADWRAAHPD